ncbi:MAG: hypothetical protein Q8N57_03950 [bacterium]|nr:hypothetical protein [bacterium]
MIDDKSKKILERNYADSLPEIIDYIVFHDEQPKALKLFKVLEKAVNENINELKSQPDLLDFYKGVILKLKFACLPVLDDKEVIDMMKNNFCFQLRINDYDFFRKLNAKFLNIIVIEDRNKLKEDLKRAISENNEKITASYEIKLVKDWLKNYVAKIGLNNIDKLVKAQYLVSLKNNKQISPLEYASLTALFKFYDILNIPSDSPEGLEEELPITIDGKLYIFRRGVLEAVPENPGIAEAMRLTGETEPEGTVLAPLGSDDDLFISRKTSAQTIAISPSLPPLAELENLLKNYPAASLEHKAISQEISRLKSAEFKRVQKADQKLDAKQ